MDNQQNSAGPELEITGGENLGKSYKIKRKTRIGRERDNDIVITDPRMSRYHAQIGLEAGQWVITDLGSFNKTYVNGQPIDSPTYLQAGDRINIGETEITFRSGSGLHSERTTSVKAVAKEPPAAILAAPVAISAVPNRPSRLVWLAGGFALILCVAAIAVLFLINRSRGTDTAASPSPASTHTVTLNNPVVFPSDLQLTYEDDFSDSSSGWDDAFDTYTTKQYGNNRYQIEVNASNLMAWGLANRDVADFELEVESKQEAGDKANSYGLLFRVKDRENFYRFDLSGDRFYLLTKFVDGQWITLVDWTLSEYINEDTNLLKVSAFGTKFTVWVNGHHLATIEDDSFSHGNFGFFSSAFNEPHMWVSYDNLKLSTLTEQNIAIIPTATRPKPPTPTNTPTPVPVSDTIQITPAGQATTPVAVKSTATPTKTPTTTPTTHPTETPIPLPEYASRDQPLGHKEEEVTGRIIFPLFDADKETYNIYIADAADGANMELVQKEASQPAANKDGTELAYRSWQQDKRGLFARPVAGGDEWGFNLFFESARPQFSPLDDSLIYHSRTGGKEPAVYKVVNGVGQVMRRNGAPIQGKSPKISPDGQKFIYNSCFGGTCGIIISNMDGSFPKLLTNQPMDTNPEISPDGTAIIFMSNRSGDWEIYRMDIDGENLTALTADDANDGLPTWSPDGSKIAFATNRDGEWGLWDMNPDGSNQRRLFPIDGSVDGTVRYDIANSHGWSEENIVWIP